MNDLVQAAASGLTRRDEERGQLIGFAIRVAHGWADQLNVGKDAVEWVALKGGGRSPVSSTEAGAVIHRLENDTGIAFVLGSAGEMDLLFVVSRRSTTYSVNISNNARPGDRSERFNVHHDHVGDLKHLLAAAKRYVRKVAA